MQMIFADQISQIRSEVINCQCQIDLYDSISLTSDGFYKLVTVTIYYPIDWDKIAPREFYFLMVYDLDLTYKLYDVLLNKSVDYIKENFTLEALPDLMKVKHIYRRRKKRDFLNIDSLPKYRYRNVPVKTVNPITEPCISFD